LSQGDVHLLAKVRQALDVLLAPSGEGFGRHPLLWVGHRYAYHQTAGCVGAEVIVLQKDAESSEGVVRQLQR
jgi:hypothetical protein